MTPLKKKILRVLLFLAATGAGCYYTAIGLYKLSQAAIFVHESIVLPATVVDMRVCPFESMEQQLDHGNLPWDGDISYRPTITFNMPGTVPIPVTTPVNDLDNRNYLTGEQIEIATLPNDPNSFRLNQWKFIWGRNLPEFLLGMLLLSPAIWLLISRKRKKKSKAPHKSTPKGAHKKPRKGTRKHKAVPLNSIAVPEPEPQPEPAPVPAPAPAEQAPAPRKPRARKKPAATADKPAASAPRKPRKKPQVLPLDDSFQLTSDGAPAPKPRRPRKKKEASTGA